MRLFAIAVALLGVLVACDTGGGGAVEFDTAAVNNFDTTYNPPISQPSTAAMGTQVGSEGFWGCPILTTSPLTDLVSVLPALGGSPAELATARMGTRPLAIEDIEASASDTGSLVLVDGSNYLWIDVAEESGCYDHLAMAVWGTITRGDSALEPISGWLAIRDGASRLLVTSDAPLETTAAVWGEPEAPSAETTLRIDADLDESTLDGHVLYVDCDRIEVECQTAETLASVKSSR